MILVASSLICSLRDCALEEKIFVKCESLPKLTLCSDCKIVLDAVDAGLRPSFDAGMWAIGAILWA